MKPNGASFLKGSVGGVLPLYVFDGVQVPGFALELGILKHLASDVAL